MFTETSSLGALLNSSNVQLSIALQNLITIGSKVTQKIQFYFPFQFCIIKQIVEKQRQALGIQNYAYVHSTLKKKKKRTLFDCHYYVAALLTSTQPKITRAYTDYIVGYGYCGPGTVHTWLLPQ